MIRGFYECKNVLRPKQDQLHKIQLEGTKLKKYNYVHGTRDITIVNVLDMSSKSD